MIRILIDAHRKRVLLFTQPLSHFTQFSTPTRNYRTHTYTYILLHFELTLTRISRILNVRAVVVHDGPARGHGDDAADPESRGALSLRPAAWHQGALVRGHARAREAGGGGTAVLLESHHVEEGEQLPAAAGLLLFRRGPLDQLTSCRLFNYLLVIPVDL